MTAPFQRVVGNVASDTYVWDTGSMTWIPWDATIAVSVSVAKASTATRSDVAAAGASQIALAALTARLDALFVNRADTTCYLKLGATAAVDDYAIAILPGGQDSLSAHASLAMYNGRIDVIWAGAPTGELMITELTP